MKKVYKKPTIGLFPTKCHVSSLSSEESEEMDRSRRSLLRGVGLMATVGHLSVYGGSDSLPFSTSTTLDTWNGETVK